MLWAELCSPKTYYIAALNLSIWNVSVIGDGACKERLKLK